MEICAYSAVEDSALSVSLITRNHNPILLRNNRSTNRIVIIEVIIEVTAKYVCIRIVASE